MKRKDCPCDIPSTEAQARGNGTTPTGVGKNNVAAYCPEFALVQLNCEGSKSVRARMAILFVSCTHKNPEDGISPCVGGNAYCCAWIATL